MEGWARGCGGGGCKENVQIAQITEITVEDDALCLKY